jgi:hypothetical protein
MARSIGSSGPMIQPICCDKKVPRTTLVKEWLFAITSSRSRDVATERFRRLYARYQYLYRHALSSVLNIAVNTTATITNTAVAGSGRNQQILVLRCILDTRSPPTITLRTDEIACLQKLLPAFERPRSPVLGLSHVGSPDWNSFRAGCWPGTVRQSLQYQ